MIVSKVTVPNQSAMLSRRCVGLIHELLCACAFLRLKCARARTKAASLEGFLLQRRHSRPNLWSDDFTVSRMCILTSDVHTDLVVRRYVEIYAREPSSALGAFFFFYISTYIDNLHLNHKIRRMGETRASTRSCCDQCKCC